MAHKCGQTVYSSQFHLCIIKNMMIKSVSSLYYKEHDDPWTMLHDQLELYTLHEI